ncbi:MAG: hypothetical protein GY930_17560 [bacterium]|nr:hypothetical protein [bacterium]
MCHVITLVLPSEAAQIMVAGTLAPLQDAPNPHVLSKLQTGELYVAATGKGWDCDTPIGSASKGDPLDKDLTTTQTAKLRKKGWGPAKIKKWLENKERADAKSVRVAEANAQADALAASEWIRRIGMAVNADGTGYAGLCLHWYRGSIDDEPIKLERWVHLDLATVQPEDLTRFKEDVLYVFS